MSDKRAVVQRLARILHPICELDDGQQLESFRGARTDRLTAKQTFLVENEKEWLTFLLEGDLQVEDDRGTVEIITATTPRAKTPLFKLFPRGMVATTHGGQCYCA